jgi:hypothetical protein
MHNRVVMILAAVAAAAFAACSSSTAPSGPSLTGTWHVSAISVGSGSVSPTSFSFTVSGSPGSYTVTAPTLTWSTIPVTFDSVAFAGVFSDSSIFGITKLAKSPTQHCEGIEFYGTKNAGLDTLTSVGVLIAYSDTSAGGFCTPVATGTATIHK